MEALKHVAILRSGGRVEITLPLMALPWGMERSQQTLGPAPESWREDQNGVLINLAEVAAIVGAEP